MSLTMTVLVRLCLGATLVLALSPLPAAASNFTVTPTEVNFAPGTSSALVTLRNTGKTTLRFEITVFRWSESERGEMILEPSTDVTFFPRLIELPAGTSRNVRIGVNKGVMRDVEQSFRLFVEELPDQSAATPNAVAIRTKMGLPVFVRPAKPNRSAVIDGVEVKGGTVLTRVRNTGNLHINVENIALNGSAASKAASFSKAAPGWYILPGATRVFEVPLTADECKATTSVAVEVFGHNASLKGMGQVAPTACAPR
jgi:fimbrial chaperone protein